MFMLKASLSLSRRGSQGHVPHAERNLHRKTVGAERGSEVPPGHRGRPLVRGRERRRPLQEKGCWGKEASSFLTDLPENLWSPALPAGGGAWARAGGSAGRAPTAPPGGAGAWVGRILVTFEGLGVAWGHSLFAQQNALVHRAPLVPQRDISVRAKASPSSPGLVARWAHTCLPTGAAASTPPQASCAARGHKQHQAELAPHPGGMWCVRVQPDYFYL